MQTTRTLMIQGTTSDAGKSTLVTALCRWLVRQQISVAPFKPQNMALNSAVTSNGGEIGRAQAVQAQACRLEPHTDMNPVLLKPSSDTGAQVIINGKAVSNMDARFYHDYKMTALQAVLDSHRRLSAQYHTVIVEGAGSPAEINLRDRDIANMGFAEVVDCPVILIADIDRGGVFAHLIGTLELLSASEQERIKGFVINRFRGDISLLESGLEWLEKRTGKPVLGVLPYLHGLHLDAEDAINTQQSAGGEHLLNVIVPVLPRISNHTDFDPLRLHPQVNLQFIGPDSAIPSADLIIIPGSKSVRNDLNWLRQHGWQQKISHHLRYGGKVLGICGGLQMLGHSIADPYAIEGSAGTTAGLGLLDIETTLSKNKILRNVSGLLWDRKTPVTGYEIHHGETKGKGLNQPFCYVNETAEGVISADNQVAGTYLHGLFEHCASIDALLDWAGLSCSPQQDYQLVRETQIDRLADMIEQYMDTAAIRRLLML